MFYWLLLLLVYGFLSYLILKSKSNTTIRSFIIFLVVWLAYVLVLSRLGILQTFSLPPRLPLLVLLPLFTLMFFFLKRADQSFIKRLPIVALTLFQSFRIGVELLIHQGYLVGELPVHVTLEGYNFEFYFACTALIVSLITFRNPIRFKKLLTVWNILGLGFLVTVVLLFMTHAFFPGIWGNEVSAVQLTFLDTPNILIAAVFMPAAVLVHFLSLKWLKVSEG